MFTGAKTEEYGIYNSSSICLTEADETTIPVALFKQNLLS